MVLDVKGAAPDLVQAGNLLAQDGRIAEAVAAYEKAIELDPRLVSAHNNLGVQLERHGHLTDAVKAYDRALAVDPAVPEVHANMGNALRELCRFDAAVTHYRRALELDPAFSRAHSALLFCLNYHPGISIERLYEEYGSWEQKHARPLQATWHSHANARVPDRRLRIGYLSPDFRGHSARHFVEPVLINHDRRSMEVWCYSDVALPDGDTARLKALAHQWVDATGFSDESLAERIRADGIDILVDLAGHTARNRMLLLARKPAPVQVTWLGYGYTTGLRAVDYFLTTRGLVPEGFEAPFSETVYRLPGAPFSYLPADKMPPVGPSPVERKGYVTFGCFSRTVRLNDRVVATWSRILSSVANSRLLLNHGAFAEEGVRRDFAQRFERAGADPGRISMVFTSPQPATWSAYNEVDIALDPFPHNAGTTTIESLWMGVPVVTLAGAAPLGRLGAALLELLGMDGWTATTEDDYVRIATNAARELGRLAQLRASLRKRMSDSAICDTKKFTRELEEAYREMWRRWCGTSP